MNSFSRSKKENLKEQIDKLDATEHRQIYNIMNSSMKNELLVTKTQNGVLVSANSLNDESLQAVEQYVLFCLDQRKRMDEDAKTRKTYERMV
jgi:hypothetical protein